MLVQAPCGIFDPGLDRLVEGGPAGLRGQADRPVTSRCRSASAMASVSDAALAGSRSRSAGPATSSPVTLSRVKSAAGGTGPRAASTAAVHVPSVTVGVRPRP
jgi:hypothetical protein